MNDALIRLVLIIIASMTAVTGLAQIVIPSTILGLIAAAASGLDAHLFATIGMFMLITGGMFLQSLVKRSPEPAIPLWIGIQKALAAVFVARAIVAGLFLPLALAVAVVDAASAVIAFVFWARLRR